MATKKKNSTKFGAKAEFVRSTPLEMSASDVVAAAAKKGMSLSTAYVYNIRSGGSKRSAGSVPGAKRGPKPGSKRGPKPGAKRRGRPSAAGSAENQLRRAIAELGLTRSREIIAAVERAFAGL